MDLFSFERNRALQVMSGNRFMKRRRLRFRAALLLRFVRADEKHRGTAAIFGRRVVFVGPALLAELWIGLDDDIGFRKKAEPLRRRGLGARQRFLRVRDQILAGLEQEVSV